MPPLTDDGEENSRTSRRAVLQSVGGGIGVTAGIGAGGYLTDDRFTDEDGDGIPDRKERSDSFHRRLTDLFGENQFEGLDPDRRDLLLDIRYVGETSIDDRTKRTIEQRFRDHGVYAQWLDYPHRYDHDRIEREYGWNAKTLLWDRTGLYREEVEPFVRDVAVQVFVIPGHEFERYGGLVYSPWANLFGGGVDGHVNGFSVGNRAVVCDRNDKWEQERLLFHEIAHLTLCHDDDPDNTGVMGTNEEIALTDDEWDTLRTNLDAVRDTTGYDIAFRRCLWEGCLEGVADRLQ